MSTVFFLISHQTTYIRQEVFFQQRKLCETCPRIWQVSKPIDIPIITDALHMLDIQIRMCSSGNVIVLQCNREWFYSRRLKFDSGFNVMGGIWSFLTWTKSHVSLLRHPGTNLEVVEETLLILQEIKYYFLLELVDAVPRWMFSGLDLFQGVWFVHLRLE